MRKVCCHHEPCSILISPETITKNIKTRNWRRKSVRTYVGDGNMAKGKSETDSLAFFKMLQRKTSEETTSVYPATCKLVKVEASWNMMAHAQKPDFVFRRNGRVHLNRRGESVQSTTGSRCVRISRSNAGYIMFRGSVKSTGYPLHSPVSPSLPLPCVTVFHHISTGL